MELKNAKTRKNLLKTVISVLVIIVAINIGKMAYQEFFASQATLNKTLYEAVINNDLKRVKTALHKGADLNYKDALNHNLIFTAVKNDKKKVLKYLISKGLDYNQRVKGITPLLYAISLGSNNSAEVLMNQKDIDLRLKQPKGKDLTALFLAIIMENTKIAKMLLDKGLNINDVNFEKSSLLMLAALKLQNNQVFDFLLENKADVNQRDSYKNTPLFYAISGGNLYLVKRLVKDFKVKVNAQNNEGMSPLMLAANEAKPAIVEFLLKNGAKKSLRDKKGNSPLDYAVHGKNKKIIELLKK